ncbi:MAG: lipoyl synthase [bacterium]|nr:lipoyl synthase [bacterium]
MNSDGLIPDLQPRSRDSQPSSRRKPEWLRMKRRGSEDFNEVRRLLRSASLSTVCETANCPNRAECFGSRTATFLLMGDVCTRHCTFCNIPGGQVASLDAGEPKRIAETVAALGLKFAVVTSVTRDDLPDGGAAHFSSTIRHIRRLNANCGVEVLIPDFLGRPADLETVFRAQPEVLNHNLETVPRLYQAMRPQANYGRSLAVLKRTRQWVDAFGLDMKVKTGIMLGVGEKRHEVIQLLKDAAEHGTQILTIGQYLQPSQKHHPVIRYVEPADFDELGAIGRELGIGWVESGPLVRSSYHAREQSETLEQGASAPANSSKNSDRAGTP